MSDPNARPLLVSWKKSRKVPIEVVREIKTRGVEDLATELLADLRALETKKVAAIRWRAYALLAWCVEQNSTPPPVLMRLLFECLELKEGRPHKDVCKRYEWANLMKASIEDYDRVVDADAQSIIETGSELSSRALEMRTGVAWKTVDDWREGPEYEKRRKARMLMLWVRNSSTS